jgi:4-hydroxybenzoate polyprenyltransferase
MSRLPTYAQLVRLPNVPSALADICLGALAAGALPRAWLPFLLLLPASACLYMAGMVFNDYFDRQQDAHERPFRPLPSGRVTPAAAARLGAGLLAVGVLLAALAGLTLGPESRPTTPPLLAAGIVVAVFAYDAWLKRTGLGPAAMGLCRFLNVLLGLSAGGPPTPTGLHLALVVGVYAAGVTWFARTEARVSNRAELQGAAVVLLAALLLALPLPATLKPGTSSVLFPYLLVAFGFAVGLPVCRAVAAPSAANVQAAVTRCLLGLTVLDAILATGLVGVVGLAILLLLVPAVYLRRQKWLYAT